MKWTVRRGWVPAHTMAEADPWAGSHGASRIPEQDSVNDHYTVRVCSIVGTTDETVKLQTSCCA